MSQTSQNLKIAIYTYCTFNTTTYLDYIRLQLNKTNGYFLLHLVLMHFTVVIETKEWWERVKSRPTSLAVAPCQTFPCLYDCTFIWPNYIYCTMEHIKMRWRNYIRTLNIKTSKIKQSTVLPKHNIINILILPFINKFIFLVVNCLNNGYLIVRARI